MQITWGPAPHPDPAYLLLLTTYCTTDIMEWCFWEGMGIACLKFKKTVSDRKGVQGIVEKVWTFWWFKGPFERRWNLWNFKKVPKCLSTTLLIRTNLNWKGLLLFSLNMFISFSDIQSICDLANSTTLKATLFRSARLYARSPESYIILFSSNFHHHTLQNNFTSSSI